MTKKTKSIEYAVSFYEGMNVDKQIFNDINDAKDFAISKGDKLLFIEKIETEMIDENEFLKDSCFSVSYFSLNERKHFTKRFLTFDELFSFIKTIKNNRNEIREISIPENVKSFLQRILDKQG